MNDEKIDLLTKRIEQLILLNCRTLGISPSLTNHTVKEFACRLMEEIEKLHFDKGEASINPEGFPPSFFPKKKIDVLDFNLFSFIKNLFRKKTC